MTTVRYRDVRTTRIAQIVGRQNYRLTKHMTAS
nr:MAG TPA: hypothetical protein [Caudoviricetes sp.]